MHKRKDSKLKSSKSRHNLNPAAVAKVLDRKTKQKSKQKSLSRKKKKVERSSSSQALGGQGYLNEYYNKEKKTSRKSRHQTNNFSDYSNMTNIMMNGKAIEKSDEANKGKLSLDKVKGVITFQGKYLKNSFHANQCKNSANSEYSSEHYTGLASQQETRRIKNKSKSKSRKTTSKTKSKVKGQGKNQRQKISSLHKTFSRSRPCCENEFEETTKNSPRNFYSIYERNEEVDLDSFKSEIKEDQGKILKLNMLKKVAFDKRSQCISMVSKICGELQLRKDVFSLTIHLFDSYLNDQVMISRHKVLSLACLLLALKLEEAEIANIFYSGLPGNKSKISELRQEGKISEAFEKDLSSSDKQKTKRREKTEEKESQQSIQKQQKLSRKKKILLTILKSEMEQNFSKDELSEFETMILLKENFRISKRTYAYWIDMLTMMWDQFLLREYLESTAGLDCILFRCLTKTQNFAYLVQILESSLYSTQFYSYNLVSMVLSAMYLLVRINMEGNDQGFEYYRINLQKSSNVLFVDMAGVNVIFGEFLSRIGVQMGEILACCQFLSTYLNQSILIDYDYEQLAASRFDHTLSIHFHNPKIFPF